MINIYGIAAFWFIATSLSAIFAKRLRISLASVEIIIGAVVC